MTRPSTPAEGRESELSDELLDRADEIVLTALGLDPKERPGYLDRLCGESAELRWEVESLLYLETQELDAVDQPVFQIHLGAEGTAEEDRIGPYRVEREIGRGGVATVYQARRVNDPDRRPLALKVLRHGVDSDEVVRGLRREGQILAQLTHPFIGRVYGGGLTEDHRPYLVMEYLEGETLDCYCRRQSPDLQTRLRLLLGLCDAVDYAHQRLVVHSDIKPSNILIDASGEPRLLDFGLAKLLDRGGERALTVTAHGRRMLTPAYASPEQVRGRAITTATDVYALGAVLYELISGHRPLDLAPKEADWRLAVCEWDPPPPSRAAARSGGLPRAGRSCADLDAIALKALRKEADHRYRSVRDLANDVQLFLEGRPVGARRGSLLYRAGKRLSRHRAALSVAALVLVLVTGFLMERQKQVERLRTESAKVSAVRDFLLDLLTGADPLTYDAGPPTVRDLLDRSTKQIEDLDDRPDVKAAVMGTLGEMYARLGDLDRAEPLILGSLEHARRHPGSVDELIQALVRASELAQERAEFSLAIELLEEGEGLLRRHRPDSEELPRVIGELGLAHRELGHVDRAESYLRQALDAFGPERYELEAAQAVRNNLGLVFYDNEQYGEAAELWAGLLEERRRRGDRRMDTALTAINLASTYYTLEDYEAARRPARESFEVLSELLGPSHPNTGAAALALAKVMAQLGEGELAVELLSSSRRSLVDDGKGDLPVCAAQALELAKLLESRDPVRALEEVRWGHDSWREIFGDAHPNLAEFSLLLARLAAGEEAQVAARDAFEIFRRHFGEQHEKTQTAKRLADRTGDSGRTAVAKGSNGP